MCDTTMFFIWIRPRVGYHTSLRIGNLLISVGKIVLNESIFSYYVEGKRKKHSVKIKWKYKSYIECLPETTHKQTK